MYTTATCLYCKNAKTLLETYAVIPEEIRIDTDHSKMQEMMEKTGMMSVPQIYIGDKHIGGFAELKQLSDSGELSAMLH